MKFFLIWLLKSILISQVLSDSFNTTKQQPSEEDFKRCLAWMEKVPAFDPETNTIECFDLTVRGPCPENEFLILNDDLTDTICSSRPCNSDIHVLFNDECVLIEEGNFCGENMTIKISAFGEGVCDCHVGQVTVNNLDGCFAVFSQGPCPDGQIVMTNNFKEGFCGVDSFNLEETAITEAYLESTFSPVEINNPPRLESFGIVPTLCDNGEAVNSDGNCIKILPGRSSSKKRQLSVRSALKLLKKRLEE